MAAVVQLKKRATFQIKRHDMSKDEETLMGDPNSNNDRQADLRLQEVCWLSVQSYLLPHHVLTVGYTSADREDHLIRGVGPLHTNTNLIGHYRMEQRSLEHTHTQSTEYLRGWWEGALQTGERGGRQCVGVAGGCGHCRRRAVCWL